MIDKQHTYAGTVDVGANIVRPRTRTQRKIRLAGEHYSPLHNLFRCSGICIAFANKKKKSK